MARSARYSWMKPRHDREEDDDRDDDRLQAVAQEGGEGRGAEQDEDEDVLELGEEDRPGRDPLRGPQLVGPVLRQPPRRLLGAQAAAGVHAEPLQHFRGFEPVWIGHAHALP